MNLRQLTAMATSRQRSEWARLGVGTAWIINRNGWTKNPVKPSDIIPPTYREPERPMEKSKEQLAEESELAWLQMKAFFSQFGKRKPVHHGVK